MVELTHSGTRAGDTVLAASTQVKARVTNGISNTLVWIENGISVQRIEIDSQIYESEFLLKAQSGKSARVRVEIQKGQVPQTTTSHLLVAESKGLAPVISASSTSGCGCQLGSMELLLLGCLLLIGERCEAARGLDVESIFRR